MVNYISLINQQGQLFHKEPKPQQDGLYGVVDFSQNTRKYYATLVTFNPQDTNLLILDSRGQVSQLLLSQNRFNVIAANLKDLKVQALGYTGKYPEDQVLIPQIQKRLIQIHYSQNGKLVESLNSHLHHLNEVTKVKQNIKRRLVMTMSSDCLNVWSTQQNKSILKLRSLQSSKGSQFKDALFDNQQDHIVTLFKGGQVSFWNIDNCTPLADQHQFDQTQIQFQFQTPEIDFIDVGPTYVVGAGKRCPYIVLQDVMNPNKTGIEGYSGQIFKLLEGQDGIEQIQLLRDKFLLCFLSNGYFYVCDLTGFDSQQQLPIKLQIRIPNQSIKSFEVDSSMQNLALCTVTGNVFLYDLPQAIKNEQIISNKKQQMGVEHSQIFQYINKVTLEEFDQGMGVREFGAGFSDMQSKIFSENNQSNALNTEHQTIVFSNIKSQNEIDNTNYKQTLENQALSQYGGVASNTKSSQYLIPGRPKGTQTYNQTAQVSILSNPTNTQQFQNPFKTNQSIIQQSTMKQQIANQPLYSDTQQNRGVPIVSTIVQRQVTQPQQSTMQSVQQQTQVQSRQEYLNAGVSTSVIHTSQIGSIARRNPNHKSNMMSVQQQSTAQTNTAHQIDECYQPDFKLTNSTLTESTMAMFNVDKLKRMLSTYGEYPEKYRSLTWKYLLELPLNKDAFLALVNQGVHPVFRNLHQQYPISSYRLYNKLVRIMSALAHWCPLFVNVEFMPALVFPFIKVIQNDDLMVFEVIVSLVFQFMQGWFDGFPADPMTMLSAIEQVLEIEDPQLLNHFRVNALLPQQYVWPMINSFFSEVLMKDDWLRLIDYLITNKDDPELLVYFAVSFLMHNKPTLLQIRSIEELHQVQIQPTGQPFKKMIKLALSLSKKHEHSINSGSSQGMFLPVVSSIPGQYPQYTKYPDLVVAHQVKQKQKVIEEQEELVKKQQLLQDLKSKADEIVRQENQVRIQQEAQFQKEKEQQAKLQEEQEMLLQERIRLDEMTRLQRLEQIKRLEDAVAQSLEQKRKLKEQENQMIEAEIKQKQRQHQYEHEARVQEEAISSLEFKANQKLLEEMQKRQSEEHQRKLQNDIKQWKKEEDHRDRVMEERWRLEDQERRLKQELMKQTLSQQEQISQQEAEKRTLELRLRQQEHERELELMKIEEQRRIRSLQEEIQSEHQMTLQQQRMQEQHNTQVQIREQEERIRQEREAEMKRIQDKLAQEEQSLSNTLKTLEEERRRINANAVIYQQQQQDILAQQQQQYHETTLQASELKNEQTDPNQDRFINDTTVHDQTISPNDITKRLYQIEQSKNNPYPMSSFPIQPTTNALHDMTLDQQIQKARENIQKYTQDQSLQNSNPHALQDSVNPPRVLLQKELSQQNINASPSQAQTYNPVRTRSKSKEKDYSASQNTNNQQPQMFENYASLRNNLVQQNITESQIKENDNVQQQIKSAAQSINDIVNKSNEMIKQQEERNIKHAQQLEQSSPSIVSSKQENSIQDPQSEQKIQMLKEERERQYKMHNDLLLQQMKQDAQANQQQDYLRWQENTNIINNLDKQVQQSLQKTSLNTSQKQSNINYGQHQQYQAQEFIDSSLSSSSLSNSLSQNKHSAYLSESQQTSDLIESSKLKEDPNINQVPIDINVSQSINNMSSSVSANISAVHNRYAGMNNVQQSNAGLLQVTQQPSSSSNQVNITQGFYKQPLYNNMMMGSNANDTSLQQAMMFNQQQNMGNHFGMAQQMPNQIQVELTESNGGVSKTSGVSASSSSSSSLEDGNEIQSSITSGSSILTTSGHNSQHQQIQV